MPLTDLIRYFNSADHAEDSSLYQAGPRAAAWHRGLRLGSLFQPIVDLRQGRVIGHQAWLTAERDDGTPVSSEAAYALCQTAASVIHFDRLCRTLHALNFLAQRRHAGGYLQLEVHHRHLQAIQNQHGLVYEAILKRCGLGPEDIVLVMAADAGNQSATVHQALNNYRQRGYRLALATSRSGGEVTGMLALRPAILTLPITSDPQTVNRARQLGVITEAADIDCSEDEARARSTGFDRARGRQFGRPLADCIATHSQGTVAYNPDSSSGATP